MFTFPGHGKLNTHKANIQHYSLLQLFPLISPGRRQIQRKQHRSLLLLSHDAAVRGVLRPLGRLSLGSCTVSIDSLVLSRVDSGDHAVGAMATDGAVVVDRIGRVDRDPEDVFLCVGWVDV